jgi:hypothetical protein
MANILEANSIYYILITFGLDAAIIAAAFGLCELIHCFVFKRLQSTPTYINSSLSTLLLRNQEFKERDPENGGNIFTQFKKTLKLSKDDIRRKCTNDEQIYLLFVKYHYQLFCVCTPLISVPIWLRCTLAHVFDRAFFLPLL